MVNLRKRKSASVQAEEQSGSDLETSDAPSVDAEQQGARSPAAKRQKENKPSRQSKSPQQRQVRAQSEPGTGLLDVVKHHGSASSLAAKEWVDEFQTDKAEAVAKLLTFLVQASGSREAVTLEDVEEGEVDKLVQGLLKKVTQDGLDDHFKGKGQKAFKANYLELWDKIVREANTAGILFDDFLLEKLTHLVIALNCSVVRNFRYVATLTASQLVTSWIRIMITLTEARETSQRQLAVEEKKKGNKSLDRIGSFTRTIDQCHRRVTDLMDYIKTLFDSVSAHRFRDVSEDIRAAVIEGIGSWTTMLPSEFLQDSYLKYIAWALSDKEALVRYTAATALLKLYSDEDNVSPLHEFTNRFATRFLELIYDKDESVAVKGVELVTQLVKLEELEHSSVRDVYRLLVDDAPAIRHAAAELVAGSLLEQGRRQLDNARDEGTGRTPGRKKKAASQAHHTEQDAELAGLLYMMYLLANDEEEDKETMERRRLSAQGLRPEEQALSPEMVSHVVDALFDRVEILQNWKALSDALLSDVTTERFGTTAATNLAHVLRDAVHKATGGTLVASRHDARRHASKAKQSAAETSRQDLTVVLIKVLPNLLKRFQTDAVKVGALVSLVRDLKLEVYSLKRQEKGFEALLRLVADLLFKHVAAATVDQCLQALLHCATEGPDALQGVARAVFVEAVERLVKSLAAAVEQYGKLGDTELSEALEAAQEDEDAEDQELFALRAALLRLHRLQLISGDAGKLPDSYESLNRLLEDAANGRQLGGPITSLAMQTMFLLLTWQLQSLEPGDPDGSSLQTLASRRSLFATQLEAILGSAELEEVQDAACFVQADLFLMFTNKLRGTRLEAAAFLPSDAALKQFWQHCEVILEREVDAHADDEEEDDDKEADDGALQKQDEKLHAKGQVVYAVGRLVLSKALLPHSWLGPQLVSHLVSHGKNVTDAIREVCRVLKKTEPESMPAVYLEALQIAYQRHLDADASADGLEEVAALSSRLAQSYAGFNASAAAMTHILQHGVDYALQSNPTYLGFLEVLLPFSTRLPARQAETMAATLIAKAAPHQPSEDSTDWDLYFALLEALKGRAVKAKTPKSALRKTARGKAAGRRKISFAAVREDDEDVQEEEEEDAIEEDADEGEDGEEEGEEDVEDADNAHEASPSLPHDDGPSRPAEDEEEGGEEEDNGEEDQEEVAVMPTEEQLPQSTRPTPRSRRRLQNLYAADSEVTGAATSHGADSDEELLQGGVQKPAWQAKPTATASTRTRGTRTTPSLGGKLTQQSEEEEEEVEPPPGARRRRR